MAVVGVGLFRLSWTFSAQFFFWGGEGERAGLGYMESRATRKEEQELDGLTSSCAITGDVFSFISPTLPPSLLDHQFCLTV